LLTGILHGNRGQLSEMGDLLWKTMPLSSVNTPSTPISSTPIPLAPACVVVVADRWVYLLAEGASLSLAYFIVNEEAFYSSM
jgi:hypothetical protein